MDEKGFQTELEKQKNRSRAASEMSTEDWTVLREDDDEEFIGYDALESNVKIRKWTKFMLRSQKLTVL